MGKKIVLILSILAILIGASLMESKTIHKLIYPKQYSEYVEKYAEEFDLDENLVYSVIKAESKFNEKAISHK